MAYNHYGQFGDDADRGDRDYDRNRMHDRGRDEDRGFFERAGEEIKSWFSDDDDDRSSRDRSDSDRTYRSQGGYGRDPNTNRYGERGAHNMGRGYEPERSEMSRGSNWDDRYSSGRGRMQTYGGSDRSRSGSNNPYGSSRGGSEYGSQSSRDRQVAQSRPYGSSGRDDDSDLLIYEEISGTLGGFGNQRFASSQDDQYRNWRDRQMAQLDQDYQDYCRECEQQFHSDFDSWRSQRQGQQSQSEMASSSGSGASNSSSPASSSRSRTTGQQGSESRSAMGSGQSKSTTGGSSNKPNETASASSGRSNSNRSTS